MCVCVYVSVILSSKAFHKWEQQEIQIWGNKKKAADIRWLDFLGERIQKRVGFDLKQATQNLMVFSGFEKCSEKQTPFAIKTSL